MEERNTPPRPSVATLKAPSVATKALIALLLFSRLTAVKAGNTPVQGETSGSIPLGSSSFGVLLICLVTVVGLQLVQVGKIRTQACVSQVVKTAQFNRALAMLASTFCLWAICIEKTESRYLVGCIVVLICAWEGLKTFVTADTLVFGPLPEDNLVPETTIEPPVIPATESITTQTEDREDPQEVSREENSTAVQTDQQFFEDLLHTNNSHVRTIRRLQRAVAKYEQDLQAIRNRRPTARTVGNVYLCAHGKVWHVSEQCARNRTDAPIIMRRPCAYCCGEPLPLPPALHEILYPQHSTSSIG